MKDTGRVIVITGAMAAGKSTVAEGLVRRLSRSVHVRGDAFRRMIVNGRAPMTAVLSAEASDQLALRHRLAAHTADAYADLGFTVVVQDVILGADLGTFVAGLRTRPRHVVVLSPKAAVLRAREDARPKAGYVGIAPSDLDDILRAETPRIGYWLDSGRQTPDETVADVLAHLDDAEV